MSTRSTGNGPFISYAREDLEFVRVLHAFLVERGHEAWVDWRDIAAAAPWADEIARGIEAAEALVFVASPDSVASPACLRELDHAVSLGKKLVPLVRREVDAEAMPAALRPLHWVFARDEREQREALEAVVDALEVDLEWARRHARILVRALEWQDSGRSTSLLLRGTDLETAERGIAEAAGSVPKPVFLQLDYLQESRLEADRSDERQADLQAKHASELAGRDPVQALLVAAAAIREYRPSPSAVETAETLLRENHARLPLPPDRLVCLLAAHTAKVVAVAWAPDGRQVATAAADGEIILWDPQSATPIARVATGGSPVSTLVYGPRAPYLLAWGWYSAAAIIETRNGEVVAILDTEGSGGADAAWVAGRAALALPDKGNEIRVWDVEETTVAATLDAGTVRVTTLAASHDGRRLAAAGSSGDVLSWDIETGERRSLPTGQEEVSCMAFAPNGSDLVVGSFFGGLEVIPTATASPPTTLAQPGGIGIRSVSFSPRGDRLFVTLADGVTDVLELTPRRVAERIIGWHGEMCDVRAAPDDRRLAIHWGDHLAGLWRSRALPALRTEHGMAFAAAEGTDPSSVIVATEHGELEQWDLTDGALRAVIPVADGSLFSVVRRAGTADVIVGCADGAVRVVNGRRLGLSAEIELGRGPVLSVAAPADGRTLVAGTKDGSVWTGSLETGEGDWTADDLAARVFCVDAGAHLISVGAVGEAAFLLDRRDGHIRQRLEGHEQAVFTAVLSPDERTTATGDAGGTLRLWDTETGRCRRELRLGTAAMCAAFSTDGTGIAVGCGDGRTRVLATDSEAIQQTSIAAAREVNGVAFASGGTVVIAACADGTVQLTGRRSATQLALAARAAAGRELTMDERRLHRLHLQPAGDLGTD